MSEIDLPKKDEKRKREYKYNEKRVEPPQHLYPEDDEFSYYDYPGASARLLIENITTRIEGFRLDNLEELGIKNEDLTKYSEQIKRALFSIVREGPNANNVRIRAGAISYLGVLKYPETNEILTGIASSPVEAVNVRGVAAESLARLKDKTSRETLREMLYDPHALVRKRAIRALSWIGDEEDGKILVERAKIDENIAVRRKAAKTAQLLLPKRLQHLIPEKELKERVKQRKQLIKDDDIIRQIGKHKEELPQNISAPTIKKLDSSGGNDLVSEKRVKSKGFELLPKSIGYKIINDAPKGFVRLKLIGEQISRDFTVDRKIKLFPINPNEIILDVPEESLAKIGHQLPITPTQIKHKIIIPTWVPQVESSPVIFDILPDKPTIWENKDFGFHIRFWIPNEQKVQLVKLVVKLPQGRWKETVHTISEKRQETRSILIKGYKSVLPGFIHVRATIYSNKGGASKVEKIFKCLPTNPISMSVVPQTTGTNGEGPAHYNSSENRYYCYARFNVSNGYSFSVSLGSTVLCVVTDGGDSVASFHFTIDATTIPANSVRSLYIYTYYGSSSDVYDVFKDFGDVRMDFYLFTSVGVITDWSVWAAMAKVNLALNFVGDMTWDERNLFQEIVEANASAIYEQQSLYIAETGRYLLPSTNSDWHIYRDIEMDDNKDNDCQSGSDEADDLRDDWSSPTQWLDVWIVESLSGPPCAATVGGFSPKDGPTNKGGSDSGVIINFSCANINSSSGRDILSVVVAHEVGHFLGLGHKNASNNFMYKSTSGSNTDITHDQYRDMADHGFAKRYVP